MEELLLREPTENDQMIVMEYRDECVAFGIPKSVGFPLKDVKKYEDWLKVVRDNMNTTDKQSQFLVFRTSDNVLIGMLSVRHSLTRPDLLKYAGHIGYSVRPSERRKGYATQILKLGIEKCKNLKIKQILMICGEDNTASKKCIERNGGVLHEKVLLDDGVVQLRYWINL